MLSTALLAIALMIAALAVLLLEMLVISFGVLAAIALALGATSVVFGFRVHDGLGWSLLLLSPLAGLYILRWGLARMRRGGMGFVAVAEVSGQAGISDAAKQVGAQIGAQGVLITDAMPTGRASFPHGDVDVAVRGPVLQRGASVVVLAIDGPTVTVELYHSLQPLHSQVDNAIPR